MYAAVALHPSMKYGYFEFAWDSNPSPHSVLQTTTHAPSAVSTTATILELPPATESALTLWKQERRPRQGNNQDELDEFTTSDTLDSLVNPRVGWIQHINDYPKLATLALRTLAIPVMSAEVKGGVSVAPDS